MLVFIWALVFISLSELFVPVLDDSLRVRSQYIEPVRSGKVVLEA